MSVSLQGEEKDLEKEGGRPPRYSKSKRVDAAAGKKGAEVSAPEAVVGLLPGEADKERAISNKSN